MKMVLKNSTTNLGFTKLLGLLQAMKTGKNGKRHSVY